jgi:hypothetical protein
MSIATKILLILHSDTRATYECMIMQDVLNFLHLQAMGKPKKAHLVVLATPRADYG